MALNYLIAIVKRMERERNDTLKKHKPNAAKCSNTC